MEYIGTIENDIKLFTEKKIIIFGSGKVGKHCYQEIAKRECSDNVMGFCDSNMQIVGHQILGKNIYSVDKAVELFPDAVYLIASIYVKQMIEKLEKCGITKIHIIRESN